MPQKTPIGWTDFSSNPVRFRRKSDGKIGWHCVKVSTGCAHCYSETVDKRFGLGLGYTSAASTLVEPVLIERELAALLRLRGPARVFLGSMTDLFLEMIPDGFLDRVFDTIARCPNLTFQILTKRPERARSYFSPRPYPSTNVHFGVTAEDQAEADRRIPILLSIPAAVRFVSCEPLLGPINLGLWRVALPSHREDWPAEQVGNFWIIVGGESGPKRREMALDWLLSIVDQCRDANVPLYVKQDSALRDGQQGRIPDATWSIKEFPRIPVGE